MMSENIESGDLVVYVLHRHALVKNGLFQRLWSEVLRCYGEEKSRMQHNTALYVQKTQLYVSLPFSNMYSTFTPMPRNPLIEALQLSRPSNNLFHMLLFILRVLAPKAHLIPRNHPVRRSTS